MKEKGTDIYPIFEMLIAFRMDKNNKDFSIRQFLEWAEKPEILEYYHLEKSIVDRTVYRAVGIFGENLTLILQEILRRIMPHLPSVKTIYMDWTTVVLWGFKSPLGEYGYSRDKRGDKKQITVGAAITSMPYCIPIGMTVEPGNTCDTVHFPLTFDQISNELEKGTLIAFDKGPASKENKKMLEERGFYYLTSLKFNASIDEQIKTFCKSENNCLNPDAEKNKRIYYLKTSYENHMNFLYFSEEKKIEEIESIRQSVEKKYNEAILMREKELKSEQRKREGKKGDSRGRKKKVDNDFVITKRTVQAPLIDDIPREEAIAMGIQRKLTGREGFFVLSTNKNMTPEDALRIYREKDAVEKLFYSLKNEIPFGPVRSWTENNVKGICLITYLAHLFLALTRLFIPELVHVSDKIILISLKNLTETFVYKGKKMVKSIISNIDMISGKIVGLELPKNWAKGGEIIT